MLLRRAEDLFGQGACSVTVRPKGTGSQSRTPRDQIDLFHSESIPQICHHSETAQFHGEARHAELLAAADQRHDLFAPLVYWFIARVYSTICRRAWPSIPQRPAALHDLIVEVQSARVVIEVGAAAGWVKDLCEALEVPVQVAIYDWVMSDLAIGGDGRLTA